MAFRRVRGTRDFLPDEQRKRIWIMDRIKEVYERYGFEPLESPALETFETLSNKQSQETLEEIYSFKDRGGRLIGLRFDLTVPLARIVGSNKSLPKPFKRYCISRAWRYERPQAGRYREFYQADADIVGVKGMEADAECLACAVDALRSLGFKDFEIRLNNRKILTGLALDAGIPEEKVPEVFRALDKLEKIGEENVIREMRSAGITNEQIDKIMGFAAMSGDNYNILEAVKECGNEISLEGVVELERLLELCGMYGIDKYIRVDLSLVRGLAYYTGPIFEVYVKGWESLGSCAGGGRYDELIGLFGDDNPVTGISLGVDRIYEIMEKEDMFPEEMVRKVYIAPVGDVEQESIEIAQKLRSSGINTELGLKDRSLSKQLSYCNSKDIRCVLIVGEKDLKDGKVTLRDLRSGEEKKINIDNIVKEIAMTGAQES